MRWQDRIPLSWRLRLQIMRRDFHDRRAGFSFAKTTTFSNEMFPYKIQQGQTIKPSHLFENKLHNIDLASQRINRVLILPGNIFSFWHAVGAPNQRNGFKAGRNLIAGELVEGFGGGLCQLSGLIYHLSLLAGLTHVERHAHSVDIYREEERYTPLGADATVVFGYKDLRILNNYPFALNFQISQSPNEVTGTIRSEELIKHREVDFIRTKNGLKETVDTYLELEGNRRFVNSVVYKKRYG